MPVDRRAGILRAAAASHALLPAQAGRSEQTSGWIHHLDDWVWTEEGVRHVTDALAEAASRI